MADLASLRPRLSVIIVTWNSAHDLGKCLDALEIATGTTPADIIVVDNGSTDATCRLLQKRGFVPPDRGTEEEAPRFWLLCNDENVGFARANNQGLALVRTPFVLFLNPDTEVQPDSLPILLSYLESHPDVVAVGPRLTDADGHVQGGAAGHEPTPATLLSYSLGLYALAPDRFPGIWLARKQYATHDPIPVDWVAGAALMTRTAVARAVGGWPEDYFLYLEDVAFCRRLRQHGRVLCLPTAHVIHHIGGSVGHSQEGLARNVLGLDHDYRTRYGRTTVALLHAIGSLGFGLRWLAATFLRRRHIEGHSASPQALWRACTYTSLRCLADAVRGKVSSHT